MHHPPSGRWLCFARWLFAVGALVCMPVFAQFPTKPIRLVVPFPPGGTADVIARSVAQGMSHGLGQPVVVENKAGADGVIASEVVMNSAPDGYTLLLATSTAFSAVPVMHKNVPYDPMLDFVPIGKVGTFGFFVFVHHAVPATNLGQLFDHARANPGKLSYGSGNSTSILASALLAADAKVDMVHIPYKGDSPMTLDLVAGRLQMAVATGTLLPHVAEGKLRVLATLLPQRSSALPDVPTLTEAGAATMPIKSWAGIFGPANLPRPVADRLALELARALARADVRSQMEKVAFAPQSSTAQELGQLVLDQLDIWRKAASAAGIAAK